MSATQPYTNCRTVLTEVSEDADTPAPLRACRWLAVHAAGGEGAAATAKAGMADLLRTFQSDEVVACIAATLYLANEEPQAALSALRGHDSLEARAHSVMAMLMLQRPDLAGALVDEMNRADDEAVLTVLARGAFNMAMVCAMCTGRNIAEPTHARRLSPLPPRCAALIPLAPHCCRAEVV